MGLLFLYSCLDNELKYKPLIILISIIGIVIFPLAKWAVESFFLIFTTKEFWSRGLLMDTPGKAGGLALYHGVVFFFAIPITLIFIIIIFIKRWQ